MNNPNPFLPQGSFLEQKNKARARLQIAVFFSISLSVVALMALLIQGCRKPADTADNGGADTNTPTLPTNTVPDTNVAVTPPPDTNPPTPPPLPPPPPVPPAPPAQEDYTVIKGDTLATIAKKSGVSLKALEGANTGVDPKKLKIGQKLHIPAGASAPMAAGATATAAPEAAAAASGEQTYKVKSGDTLTTIAKKMHTTIKAIQSANNLTTTSIRVGQTLKMPASAAPAAPVETAPVPAPAPAPVVPTTPAPATTSPHAT